MPSTMTKSASDER